MTVPSGRPTCPCGGPVVRLFTPYGMRHDCKSCGRYSWGGKALVSPATHRARNQAHVAFDPLWESGTFTRGEAYRLLAEILGLSSEDCHMALMDEATALKVPEAVARIIRENISQ